MSFIWSDTGKKVAVALKCYPWLLFCLSCSDFSILAVTAFPKSLCFISKHRQLLHKICIALIAFFWLFNWSSLKMGAQNFSEAVWEDCAFSVQYEMGKKQEGSVRFFYFPSLFFATRRCLDYRHPSCVFSSELLFGGVCFGAWFCVTCITWSVSGQGFVWEVVPNCGWGQWTNFSACCVGVSCFELAVCFKLDPPVVPDPVCWPPTPCSVCAQPCPRNAQGASLCSVPGSPGTAGTAPTSHQGNCCFGFSFLGSPAHLSSQLSHWPFLAASHKPTWQCQDFTQNKYLSLVLLS